MRTEGGRGPAVTSAVALGALAHELGEERALPLSVDVVEQTALKNAVEVSVDRFGALDVVFANAGTAAQTPATIATIGSEEFERIIETNLLGVWRTVRATLPHVIAAQDMCWSPRPSTRTPTAP